MKRLRATLAIGALVFSAGGWASAAHAASVVVSIPESYATVNAGERVYFETDIVYPENEGRHDFRIAYVVKDDATGATVASSQFYKAIETQASFTDYADIPKDADAGLYLVTITLMDDTGATVIDGASASFEVASSLDWLTIYFYIIIGVVVIVGAIILYEVRRVLAEERKSHA